MNENKTDNFDDPNLNSIKNTLDEHGYIRFDFQFSYWILCWAIFYYFIKEKNIYFAHYPEISNKLYKYGNPLLVLYIALFENIATFFILLFFHPTANILLKFLFMILLIKIIPIYLLQNCPVKIKENIIVFIVIFSLYNIYIILNGTNVFEVYYKTIYFIYTGQNKTPLFSLLSWFGI